MLRRLLRQGNGKLGPNIYHWSIPAVVTCVGYSLVCLTACYARKGRFRTRKMKKLLRDNLAASKEPDFVGRMIDEIQARWCQVVRIHVAGDFYSATYVLAWILIAKACPKTHFYAYTRSWRDPEVEVALGKLAKLRNVRLWYSADRETGMPTHVPKQIRVAWMLDQEDQEPDGEPDLLFATKPLRKSLSLPLLCPSEQAQKDPGVDCGTCGTCWK